MFRLGEKTKIYEEGTVIRPPLPAEIIDEINAGNPHIEVMGPKVVTNSSPDVDFVSEMKFKGKDMSKYKVTGTTNTTGGIEEPEKPKEKPKLVRRRKK
jgi:hypothetical protein